MPSMINPKILVTGATRKTMAPELVAGTSQPGLIALYAQRLEQFCAGIAG